MLRSIVILVLVGLFQISPAWAGVYADDLSRCLVKSASADDQTMLVQWIFAAFALHPAVAPYANITAAQHNVLDTKAAALMERLITVNCRSEAIAALKYEGTGAFNSGFEVLGGVASRGLMNDPQVAKGMESFASHFDKTKLDSLTAEAGVAPKSGSAK